jgi:hypothetical protein
VIATQTLATPVWLIVLLAVLPPLAAVGGSVAAPYMQARSDHKHWLRDRRFEAYLAAEEAIAHMQAHWADGADSFEEFRSRAIDGYNEWIDAAGRLQIVGPPKIVKTASDVSASAKVMVDYCREPANWDDICTKDVEDWPDAKAFKAPRNAFRDAVQRVLQSGK